MPPSPCQPVFAEPPLRLNVQTSDHSQVWSVYTLHETPPQGFLSGWGLLEDVAPTELVLLRSLCVDSERVFPAFVNDQLCVVIEQEFQASDCGDAWHEDARHVTERLCRSLLPRLRSASFIEAPMCGVVAEVGTTFCGRPTVMVALPARTTAPADVKRLLGAVLEFAYPNAHH
jgi:hypothetical protein